MKETRAWILVIGFLAIGAYLAFSVVNSVNRMVGSVKDTTENAINPINEMTGGLATQVSQFLNPTPTVLPDPVVVIRSIRTLSRLETIQYTIEIVVTADKGQGSLEFLFGDELIFVAHGEVIAGVDLGKLEINDLWWDSGILYVRLPEPEILSARIDNDKSYIFDREKGLFTKGDIHLETVARQVAEREIEKTALEDGILDLARVNAESFLFRLLHSLDISEIIFVLPEPQVET
jgi:hypothetical protein